MFTKIWIAKHAVNITIAGAVQSAVTTIIINNTEKNEDDLVVKLPSAVVGVVVADKLRTRTDAMVDKTAAKIKNFKNRKDTTE